MVGEVICLTPVKIEHRAVTAAWGLFERTYGVRMKYVEFGLLRQLGRIVRGREDSPPSRVLKNGYEVIRILFSRDKVLVLGMEPFRALSWALGRLKRRHRCIFHGSWPWHREGFGGLLGSLRRRVWLNFFRDTVFVCSTQPATEAVARYGAKAHHIPWPVDTDIFCPGPDGKRTGTTRVLFIGELAEIKGIHVIMDVITSGRCPDTTFVFVGRGALQGQIESLRERGFPVEYLGYIRDAREVASVIRSCDMLVLPSVRLGKQEEVLGMVLIEAMACGRPVIASDLVGPREIVEDGEDGLLVPQGDPAALAAAIRVLAADPAQRGELGGNGRRKAVQLYGEQVVARKWLNLLEEAARCKAHA